jgi:hypothetical protein
MYLILIITLFQFLLINSLTDSQFYDNHFYLKNSLTGTGDTAQDLRYANLCSQLNCVCCIGEISEMRCGPPVICNALNSSEYTGNQNGATWVIAFYFLALIFAGFILMGFGYKCLAEYNATLNVIGYIFLLLGTIIGFPFSLIIVCCLSNKNEFIETIFLCKCIKKKPNYKLQQTVLGNRLSRDLIDNDNVINKAGSISNHLAQKDSYIYGLQVMPYVSPNELYLYSLEENKKI